MPDDFDLNPTQGGGGKYRAKDRTTAKTTVVGLDLGIGTGTEQLMEPGQQVMDDCLPVVLASDHSSLPVALDAGELHLGEVSGRASNPTATLTRPSNTTTYDTGDLVANSVTAGAVAPLAFTAARVAAGSLLVRRIRLKKSSTTLTNARFRLHLYGSNPASGTITNGDNGAWLTSDSSYLGAFDVTVNKVFTDGAHGTGQPELGSETTIALASGQTVYGLLEARAAYAPATSEVFTVTLEVLQN